jgi:serine/threonine-protein kinase
VSDPSLLAEGSRFGGYLVGPCIGEGGMARVYRAQHEGLQRQVALKVLLDGNGKDGEGHERFLREARIVAAIKHPNVVNIFDVGVHQGRPYLVMELLEGMDLEAYVASQGPLDEPTLMDVIIPVVAGLAAVHDAGIVHRDLKPGNIFLARGRNDEMEPKLLDFGISKSSGPDKLKLTTSKGLLMGTPFYMSPEASQGLEMTPLSDQYALGVVLYEAATGANPFSGASTFGEVVRQVTTGDYPPVASRNPKLSKRMIAIIERSMHLDPSRRFPDMRAMGRDLLGLAGQRTRITWGLSFSELAQPAGLAVNTSVPPLATPAQRRDSQRPVAERKNRYVVPVALVAAAIAAVVWMRSTAPEARGVALAPHDESVTALRGVTADNSPAATGPTNNVPTNSAPVLNAAPVEAPEIAPEREPAAVVPGSVREPIAQAEPPAPEPPLPQLEAAKPVIQDTLRNRVTASLARNRPSRTRRAPTTTSRPAAPAAPSAAPAAADSPDWMISSRQSVSTGRGPDRGTNGAPILD